MEIVQHVTENKKCAFSHFHTKVELEQFSTQATCCVTDFCVYFQRGVDH